MKDLETDLTKLDQLFEEGRNFEKPYIISDDQEISQEDDRFNQLLAIRTEKEAELLESMRQNKVKINTAKNFLIDMPKVILYKLRGDEAKNNDVLSNLEKDTKSKNFSRTKTLKNTGSIFSSILLTITTLAIGIIIAIIILK